MADAILVLGALVLAYHIRFTSGLFDTAPLFSRDRPPMERYHGFFIFGAFGLVLLLLTFGAYEMRTLIDRRQIAAPVLRALLWWTFLFAAASFLLQFDPPISRMYVLVAAVGSAVAVTLVRLGLLKSIALLPRDSFAIKTVLAGASWDEPPASVYRRSAFPEVRPAGTLDRALADDPADWIEALDARRCTEYFDRVLIDNTHVPFETALAIAHACDSLHVPYAILPTWSQVFAAGYELSDDAAVPVLVPRELPLDSWTNRTVKRTLDMAGAGLALAMLWPVIALLAVLVRMRSPGPAIFSQVRYGRHGRPFPMFKLRTMHPGSEGSDDRQVSTRKDDPRIFPLGHFLRRWNLDELPQLWNVLRGDMSLVGPRPERVYHADRLGLAMRPYHFRHSVKPGMTGWAQVNGYRGDTSLEERVRHDIHYIVSWSLLKDVQILLMTVFARWFAPRPPQPQGQQGGAP